MEMAPADADARNEWTFARSERMRTIGVIITAAALVQATGETTEETRQVTTRTTTDQEQVLAHIDSIFQAYVRRDRDAIRRLHTNDWIGFQGPSTTIERGIDAYMKNAETSLEHFRGTGYEILDSEVQLFGDLALVYYVARYDYRDKDEREGSIPLRAIDIYRRENGEWNQAGSHITVIPSGGSWGEDAPPKVSPDHASPESR